jgi:hypothetical protein
LKIAFWSNANEQCNVSANLAAISVASVMRYPYSIITLENHLCSSNLGKAFCGNQRISLCSDVGTNYYDGRGMEGLLRKIYRSNYYSNTLNPHLKEILNQHLFYIPQSQTIHSEIFDYEFDHCLHPLFRMIEENFDICMIHAASHNNLSTKTILEEADLIVVNLCQKMSLLDEFFLNHSTLISKSVFIISNYDSNIMPGSKRIAYTYQIPWENIILIPENISYQNAYENGSVVQFFILNYFCSKENPNYPYIQSIKKAACIIIKRAEQMVKQKELSMC